VSPKAASLGSDVKSGNPPVGIESSSIPEAPSKVPQHSRQEVPHRRSRWSQLLKLNRRDSQKSTDSQLLELQLFPGEIVTDVNSEDIKNRIPKSIRAQCTFKDDYWWYAGDPTDLSGLTSDGTPAGVRAGIGDSSQISQPVIQKGNITIAGRPLLVEKCFLKQKETWTCEPDINIMRDTPIPPYKNGEAVVVHPQSIKTPSRLKWKEEDPIERAIDPRKYSSADIEDIAKQIGPYEFCVWLDGTIQVMMNKDLKKGTITFPRQIGGLKVSLSDAMASSTQLPSPRFRFSKVAMSSMSSLRSSKGKSVQQDSRTSRKSFNGGVEISADRPLSSIENGIMIGATKESLGEGKIGQANNQDTISKNSDAQSGHNTSPAAPTGKTLSAKSANTMNGSATLSGPKVVEAAGDPPVLKTHVPCEVIVGKTIEHGVSCFVGVKIRDKDGVKITVPTSAALEAACKSRKAIGLRNRALDHVKHPLEEHVIDVVGFHVWTMAEPNEKVSLHNESLSKLSWENFHKLTYLWL
jgi:hypothetical protein